MVLAQPLSRRLGWLQFTVVDCCCRQQSQNTKTSTNGDWRTSDVALIILIKKMWSLMGPVRLICNRTHKRCGSCGPLASRASRETRPNSYWPTAAQKHIHTLTHTDTQTHTHAHSHTLSSVLLRIALYSTYTPTHSFSVSVSLLASYFLSDCSHSPETNSWNASALPVFDSFANDVCQPKPIHTCTHRCAGAVIRCLLLFGCGFLNLMVSNKTTC